MNNSLKLSRYVWPAVIAGQFSVDEKQIVTVTDLLFLLKAESFNTGEMAVLRDLMFRLGFRRTKIERGYIGRHVWVRNKAR